MAYVLAIFKTFLKSKKGKKSKKHKKRSYDSSSDSDSEKDTGCGDMGLSVDKRLKLDNESV